MVPEDSSVLKLVYDRPSAQKHTLVCNTLASDMMPWFQTGLGGSLLCRGSSGRQLGAFLCLQVVRWSAGVPPGTLASSHCPKTCIWGTGDLVTLSVP